MVPLVRGASQRWGIKSQNILNYFSYPGPYLELVSRHKDSVLRIQIPLSFAAWLLIAEVCVPGFPWAVLHSCPGERARPWPHGGNVGLFLGTWKSWDRNMKIPEILEREVREDWSSYLVVWKVI